MFGAYQEMNWTEILLLVRIKAHLFPPVYALQRSSLECVQHVSILPHMFLSVHARITINFLQQRLTQGMSLRPSSITI